jgi:hypothetical protein
VFKILVIASLVGIAVAGIGFWYFMVSNIGQNIGTSSSDEPYTQILMTVPDKPGTYAYSFKTCAGKEALVKPTIYLSSDKQDKIIRLVKNLAPRECFITATVLATSIPFDITLTLARGIEISEPLTNETEMAELKSRLLAKNNELSNLLTQKREDPNFDKKFLDLTHEIIEIRNEIKYVKTTQK